MHSCEPLPAPPATGPNLLLQLGRLIVRSRSSSPSTRAAAPRDRLLQSKLVARPCSSGQVQTQPKLETEESTSEVEELLGSHVQALWNDQLPICIEVLLAPDCAECRESIAKSDSEAPFDKQRPQRGALLLERWTMQTLPNKPQDCSSFISSQWLLNAVRSQLHFSQLSAWQARLKKAEEAPTERRGAASGERARCVSVAYAARARARRPFARPPAPHCFPVTDIGNNVYLKVVLESLPRTDEIPIVQCACSDQPASEDLTGRLNDLTLGNRAQKYPDNSNVSRRISIMNTPEYTKAPDKLLDDRMHTNCSENGKHKCNCDEESDGRENRVASNSISGGNLDERRLKEIAKYRRRLRKECKMKKLCDSTSSDGDGQRATTHTSIPILQAARFDRLRAIGCYRNQTYLTLPARSQTSGPKTRTISTQTEAACPCGETLEVQCPACAGNRMVRSDATFDLASMNGVGRKAPDDAGNAVKKHKCDNIRDNLADNSSVSDPVVRRPKLRRFPLNDRLEEIVSDRTSVQSCDDYSPKEQKRKKTFSISSDDYVMYENCDYGTIDSCDGDGGLVGSPKEIEFERKGDSQVPSPTEMDRFRWRFDSAASMVFHTKTGLPLTSSPAPLRRGNNCFDFDDSINGISGIKSALFHPIPSEEGPPRPPPRARPVRPRLGPATGLLGSFEESALQGRLEPVATVQGFAAELGASGAFCPPHRRLPVTVFFYAPGGTNAPYMGHINLGPGGYRVARSGTIQVSLFNPHGTLVKMFVVLYDLTCMPPMARTFLRQRTLYMPAGAEPPKSHMHKWLRYLIHLRFMTSKSGKLYLHTDIRIIVSRKADLDTATAHSIVRPIAKNEEEKARSAPNRVFGGSSDHDSERVERGVREIGYDNVSYELRSFTYAPENPKYSPR